MRIAKLVIAFVLAAARAFADPGPGDFTRSLVFDGLTRDFDVHVPASYDGLTPVPLVLDFHGLNSNKTQQRNLSGFLARADASGFIVVWPQGWMNSWNAGSICCGQAWQQQLDDVGLVRAIVANVQTTWRVDRRRIYATGESNGGAMTQRLACEAADLFAAAAPVSYPLSLIPATLCTPARPPTVIHFHGLNDPLVAYEGSQFFYGAQESFGYWQSIDGCVGTPLTVFSAGNTLCERYAHCANGMENELCSIDAGHVPYFNSDLTIADVAWAELSRFGLATPVRIRKLRLQDKTGKRTLQLVSDDPVLDARPTGMNPLADGATFQVYDGTGRGESACATLPAGPTYWRASATGYTYRNAAGPCTKARLQTGKQLKVVCNGLAYTLDEPSQGAVAVRFASGARTFCGVAGGTIVSDSGTNPPNAGGKGQFTAKAAPAPVTCPVAPACP